MQRPVAQKIFISPGVDPRAEDVKETLGMHLFNHADDVVLDTDEPHETGAAE